MKLLSVSVLLVGSTSMDYEVGEVFSKFLPKKVIEIKDATEAGDGTSLLLVLLENRKTIRFRGFKFYGMGA